MNKIYSLALTLLVSAAAACSLTSCKDGDESETRVIYYPVLEMAGDGFEEITAGVPWTDPGCTATLNNEDYSDHIVVSTDLDMEDPKPGLYTVSYSAANSDGFGVSVSRQVLVTAPGDTMTGFYTVDPQSYREFKGNTVFYGAPFEVLVYGVGNDVYAISDFFGGWYAQRAGYGSRYEMAGKFTIAADGSLDVTYTSITPWGDTANSVTGTADTATGTLSWALDYNESMLFHVTAVKE